MSWATINDQRFLMSMLLWHLIVIFYMHPLILGIVTETMFFRHLKLLQCSPFLRYRKTSEKGACHLEAALWLFLYGHMCTVNVDCVKFEYVVLAKYHHMLIFEFDLLTKQHILILCKSCSSCVFKQPMLSSWVLHWSHIHYPKMCYCCTINCCLKLFLRVVCIAKGQCLLSS